MSAQPQSRIQLPPSASMQCAGCNNQIQVRIPRPRIANAPDASIIMFVHERLDKCPHCGAQYMFSLTDIDQNGTLGFGWMLIKNESTIVPGTQTNLAQAVNVVEVEKKIKVN